MLAELNMMLFSEDGDGRDGFGAFELVRAAGSLEFDDDESLQLSHMSLMQESVHLDDMGLSVAS